VTVAPSTSTASTRPRRTSSLALVWASLLTVLAGTGVASQPASGGTCPALQPGLQSIPQPTYPADTSGSTRTDRFVRSAATIAFAVDRADAQRVYATNGDTIMRTANGGCTWDAVYALPHSSTPSTQPAAENSQILLLETSPTKGTVVAVIEGLPGTNLADSTNNGGTWRTRSIASATPGWDTPSEPTSAPSMVVAFAPSNPASIYVGRQNSAWYETRDGGATWTAHLAMSDATMDNVSTVPPAPAKWITVDPTNPDEVWGTSAGGRLLHSVDHGATFAFTPTSALTGYAGVSVTKAPGRAGRLLGYGFADSKFWLLRSIDGAKTWDRALELSGLSYQAARPFLVPGSTGDSFFAVLDRAVKTDQTRRWLARIVVRDTGPAALTWVMELPRQLTVTRQGIALTRGRNATLTVLAKSPAGTVELLRWTGA
jgi:hypothetical protein